MDSVGAVADVDDVVAAPVHLLQSDDRSSLGPLGCNPAAA
jgi:hypothetical protein